MKYFIKRAKNVVSVNIFGPMEAIMRENGTKIKYKDLVFIYGRTVENMKEIGIIIICMDMVYTSGLMVEHTKENIIMIKNMFKNF